MTLLYVLLLHFTVILFNPLAMGDSTQFHFTTSDKNKFAPAGKIKIEQSLSPQTRADLKSSKCSLTF
jgi:hypothetical protein